MLEFNFEEAIWCIEGTAVEREGSAVGLIWDVIAIVRNCPVIDSGADVNVERVFVDGVSDEA